MTTLGNAPSRESRFLEIHLIRYLAHFISSSCSGSSRTNRAEACDDWQGQQLYLWFVIMFPSSGSVFVGVFLRLKKFPYTPGNLIRLAYAYSPPIDSAQVACNRCLWLKIILHREPPWWLYELGSKQRGVFRNVLLISRPLLSKRWFVFGAYCQVFRAYVLR